MSRVAVTGANGNLGRRLLPALAARGHSARAVVRSTRAAAQVDGFDPQIVDYTDRDGLAKACSGCDCVVHLVGIIKETANSRYKDAHEQSAAALSAAALQAGVGRIVHLSILGASEQSSNACLRSKARAEAALLASTASCLVLRVPMVLGEGDYASAALKAQARRRIAFTFRAASLEQPIYAGDVIDAVIAALDRTAPSGVLDLAGPRSLSRRALIKTASNGRTRVVSLPLGLGLVLAWLMERALARPPATPAMLGVLDHDDAIAAESAADALGIRLTPLQETLARVC